MGGGEGAKNCRRESASGCLRAERHARPGILGTTVHLIFLPVLRPLLSSPLLPSPLRHGQTIPVSWPDRRQGWLSCRRMMQ